MKNRTVRFVLALLLAAVTACAYYNMLYNAKEKFAQAEKMPDDKDGTIPRQKKDAYDRVIEKCQVVIENYPKSRWVDDAMLLIARCRYGQGNYEAAVSKLYELERKLPNSDLLEQSEFLKGKAYAAWDKDEAAIAALDSFILEYPKSDMLDQALYYAGLSAMALEREDEAMRYLDRLGREYPKSPFRLDADLEVAEILVDLGQYDRSLEIYERLSQNRQTIENRYRIWKNQAYAYKQLGRYAEALDLLAQADALVLDKNPEDKAASLLMAAESYEGLDSLSRAVDTYKNVTARFGKSKYSAEAQYRIGLIYQVKLDSLEAAKTCYDQVPRQYAGSEYASDAIKRSSNISTLLKLRESVDEENPDAKALRQFSLAEVELFQFEDAAKARTEYQKLLAEFPQSEYAPKAAYAIGYIYGVLLGDSLKAWESYKFLIDNYPDSQQAAYVRRFLLHAAPDSLAPPARPDGGGGDTGSGDRDGEGDGAP